MSTIICLQEYSVAMQYFLRAVRLGRCASFRMTYVLLGCVSVRKACLTGGGSLQIHNQDGCEYRRCCPIFKHKKYLKALSFV